MIFGFLIFSIECNIQAINLDGAEDETFDLLRGNGIALSGLLFRPGNETKTYFKRINATFEKNSFVIDDAGFHCETISNEVSYNFSTEFFLAGSLSFHVERSGMVALIYIHTKGRI